MRIGIDARFFGTVGKGLGRYTQKLIENLEKLDQENEYFIFLGPENFREYEPQNPRFRKVLADYRWYTFSEQVGMPRLLRRYRLDLVHFPHFNVPLLYLRPFVITIHDLILLNFPTVRATTLNRFWYWFKFWSYRLVIWSAIRRSRKIIAVSEFTKGDILKHYRVSADKIDVTYEAADHFVLDQGKAAGNCGMTLEKYGIIRPYILYVGNAYPHKNLERLVSAFARVKKDLPDLSLVLVGREDYFYRRLFRKVVSEKIGKVLLARDVPDEELRSIYAGAEAFIFPSLYEGFGIPPLEAMAVGIPVASADHPCMKEILGDSACYFDAEDEGRIAAVIRSVVADDGLRERLKIKGVAQVRKYRWDRMAEETLSVYRKEK